MAMTAYFTKTATKTWLNSYKLAKCEYMINRKISYVEHKILKRSTSYLKLEKHYKVQSFKYQTQYKNYSQKFPSGQQKLVPTIFSYFSTAKREARERRTDGITSLAKTPTHNVYSLINSTDNNKKSSLRQMFYAVQIANFGLVVALSTASIKYLTGNLDPSSLIPWGENLTMDYIGIGILATLTPLFISKMCHMLSRVPIRIYYDDYNGIYTAAFCRLFLPFKTVTYSFPAQSVEELPPNFLLDKSGLYTGPTLKIHPIQKDVYIHHMECLSAEMNQIQDADIKSNDYFPPAVASATAAVNADESISQKRESHQTHKISKTGKPKKVGYMPPAYSAAVSAIAAEKAAEGKRFASWAAAEKVCYIPIGFFVTPSFYYKMLKNTSELE